LREQEGLREQFADELLPRVDRGEITEWMQYPVAELARAHRRDVRSSAPSSEVSRPPPRAWTSSRFA